MPSKNFIRILLGTWGLSINLEERVLKDLMLTRDMLPHKDYNKIYDKVCDWIRENRTKYLEPKKITAPKAGETSRDSSELGSLRSKYVGPGKIRASEETLANLVATFQSTSSIRQAAEATELSKVSARKYLRGLELDLSVVKRGKSVDPEKIQELIKAFVKYGTVSCAWIEVGGMGYEFACRQVKAAGYEIKRGRPRLYSETS